MLKHYIPMHTAFRQHQAPSPATSPYPPAWHLPVAMLTTWRFCVYCIRLSHVLFSAPIATVSLFIRLHIHCFYSCFGCVISLGLESLPENSPQKLCALRIVPLHRIQHCILIIVVCPSSPLFPLHVTWSNKQFSPAESPGLIRWQVLEEKPMLFCL